MWWGDDAKKKEQLTFIKNLVCGKSLCHFLTNCHNNLKYDMYIIVFTLQVKKLVLNITQLIGGRTGR